jgi:tetratricopeptide (TPR) repeat protein
MIRPIKEYIRFNPTAAAYCSTTHCHIGMGQFEKALTVARKALELDGSSTDAIIRYANVSLYNGHINEAISSLEDLLKKIPQHQFQDLL